MIDTHHGWNASIKPSILGFIFSIICTLTVYPVVTHMHLRHDCLVATVVGIGCVQVVLQLIFFFQIGVESKPKWSLLLLLFTAALVLVVVLGTLWIMYNLDYDLMPQMGTRGY
ncbi:MAG: hypothetical protein QNJ27_03040 [Simkaniaceae bacterium]|nr:hypothetical protein [Simkaniaceae bacterium]